MSKILTAMNSSFLRVSYESKSMSATRKLDGGASILASHVGGDEASFSAFLKKFPKPYNAEFDAARSALAAHRQAFYEMTVPSGQKPWHLIKATLLANGQFQNTLAPLELALDNARYAFELALPTVLAGIQADSKLGLAFDPNDYPTQADVPNLFRFNIIGPEPIPDERSLIGLPVAGDWIDAIEKDMERRAGEQARFAQQSVVTESVKYLKTMAANLTELTEWADGNRPERKKQPRIFDSLVENLKANVAKLRTYAIPESSEGSALLELADRIEEELEVDRIDADDLKENIPLARATAANAFAVLESIEELGF